jgi:uncharacterized protein
MRLLVPAFILFVFILLVDLYLFKALRLFLRNRAIVRKKKIFYIIHWIIPFFTLSVFLFINGKVAGIRNPDNYIYLFNLFAVFIIIYFPKIIFLVFHLLEDLIFLSIKLFRKKIRRFLFLSYIGFFLSLVPPVFIIQGILWGKYDYRIKKESIAFSNLPASFNGLKIVQISDMHLGSMGNDTTHISKVVNLVNQLNPDIILFTGDLVNNFAEETNDYEKPLGRLKAKYGKYSVLGNHDYGDYYKWKTETEKADNLEKLKSFETRAGFHLLDNQFDSLRINNESIAVIGVGNWGRPPFRQYGNLDKAMHGCEKFPFKILLSHDPDHWREKVIKKTTIDLTFSGHTHGMQIGILLGDKRWSLARIRFREWGGLYREGNQYLYVNVGIGFIGIPARIGMPPEITLIELKRK